MGQGRAPESYRAVESLNDFLTAAEEVALDIARLGSSLRAAAAADVPSSLPASLSLLPGFDEELKRFTKQMGVVGAEQHEELRKVLAEIHGSHVRGIWPCVRECSSSA